MTRDDFIQLGILLDWAAGQGFCQIDGCDDPEEFAYRLWNESGGESEGYSARALGEYIARCALNNND